MKLSSIAILSVTAAFLVYSTVSAKHCVDLVGTSGIGSVVDLDTLSKLQTCVSELNDGGDQGAFQVDVSSLSSVLKQTPGWGDVVTGEQMDLFAQMVTDYRRVSGDDGVISLPEWQQYAAEAGLPADKIDSIFSMVAGADEVMDFAEFARFFMFKHMAGEDLQISKAEWLRVFPNDDLDSGFHIFNDASKLNSGGEPNQMSLDEFLVVCEFFHAGGDDDGKVTKNEWVAAFPKHEVYFADVAGSDGVVDFSEFALFYKFVKIAGADMEISPEEWSSDNDVDLVDGKFDLVAGKDGKISLLEYMAWKTFAPFAGEDSEMSRTEWEQLYARGTILNGMFDKVASLNGDGDSVSFGEFLVFYDFIRHGGEDGSITLQEWVVSYPELKDVFALLAGSDGEIDLSEFKVFHDFKQIAGADMLVQREEWLTMEMPEAHFDMVAGDDGVISFIEYLRYVDFVAVAHEDLLISEDEWNAAYGHLKNFVGLFKFVASRDGHAEEISYDDFEIVFNFLRQGGDDDGLISEEEWLKFHPESTAAEFTMLAGDDKMMSLTEFAVYFDFVKMAGKNLTIEKSEWIAAGMNEHHFQAVAGSDGKVSLLEYLVVAEFKRLAGADGGIDRGEWEDAKLNPELFDQVAVLNGAASADGGEPTVSLDEFLVYKHFVAHGGEDGLITQAEFEKHFASVAKDFALVAGADMQISLDEYVDLFNFVKMAGDDMAIQEEEWTLAGMPEAHFAIVAGDDESMSLLEYLRYLMFVKIAGPDMVISQADWEAYFGGKDSPLRDQFQFVDSSINDDEGVSFEEFDVVFQFIKHGGEDGVITAAEWSIFYPNHDSVFITLSGSDQEMSLQEFAVFYQFITIAGENWQIEKGEWEEYFAGDAVKAGLFDQAAALGGDNEHMDLDEFIVVHKFMTLMSAGAATVSRDQVAAACNGACANEADEQLTLEQFANCYRASVDAPMDVVVPDDTNVQEPTGTGFDTVKEEHKEDTVDDDDLQNDERHQTEHPVCNDPNCTCVCHDRNNH